MSFSLRIPILFILSKIYDLMGISVVHKMYQSFLQIYCSTKHIYTGHLPSVPLCRQLTIFNQCPSVDNCPSPISDPLWTTDRLLLVPLCWQLPISHQCPSADNWPSPISGRQLLIDDFWWETTFTAVTWPYISIHLYLWWKTPCHIRPLYAVRWDGLSSQLSLYLYSSLV